MSHLKNEYNILFSRHTEKKQPLRCQRNSLSDALRDCSEEEREELVYIGVFATKTRWLNIKRLLLKKKETSEVNEFSSSLCVEDVRV